MYVGFNLAGNHFARIAVAGMAVHDEVLREHLQDHGAFRQKHALGARHGAVDVALFDGARAPQIVQTAAVGPADSRAHSHHGALHGDLGGSLGLPQRGQHAFRDGGLVGDQPLHPALRGHRSATPGSACSYLPGGR